jgi:4-hydroxybenzoate polyprenyltransferase
MKYLKLIRFQNLVAMVLIQYLLRYSILIPTYGKANVLGDLQFALLVLSMVLIAAGGYVINNYFDIQVDTENQKEEILVGRSIKRRVALMLHVLFTSTGVLLGFYIAYKVHYLALGAIMAIAAYMLWDYSLRLKRRLFVGNFIIAKLSAIFVFSLAAYEVLPKYNLAESRHTLILLCIYAAFAFICSLMHEVIKDLRGAEGDAKFKIRTLPTVWGLPKTKEFVKWLSVLTAFMVIAVAIYEFKTQVPALSYAIIFLIAPLLLLNIWIYKAEKPSDYERISKLNKFIIFAGIMSLCFFI